jgi:hypothetical protein
MLNFPPKLMPYKWLVWVPSDGRRIHRTLVRKMGFVVARTGVAASVDYHKHTGESGLGPSRHFPPLQYCNPLLPRRSWYHSLFSSSKRIPKVCTSWGKWQMELLDCWLEAVAPRWCGASQWRDLPTSDTALHSMSKWLLVQSCLPYPK